MTIKPNYTRRQIKHSSRWLVIEIDSEGYESVIAECATGKYAMFIIESLNQAVSEC